MEAIRTSEKLSCQAAARIYNLPETTLRNKMKGRMSRLDIRANCQKLTKLEEDVIVKYILDMELRGYAPRLAGVEDLANHILRSRAGKQVGKLWTQRFIRRRQELKTRFNRVYDFQRARYKDPELL